MIGNDEFNVGLTAIKINEDNNQKKYKLDWI